MTATTTTAIRGTRCSNYTHNTRCTRLASVWMICPDGKRCPGGPVCEECAIDMLVEYEIKLGETWNVEECAFV